MAQKVRFVDSVSVSAFGDTGPTSVISASAERKENKSVIKFTQANGNNFTVPIVASASAFDAVVSASVNLNQITFERGDETTFSIIVDTGSLSNEAFIKSLTAAGISGSFNIVSSSFSTRVSANEIVISKTLLSSSAQIANDISGSFTAASSSFSTRVTANETIVAKTLLSSSAQIAGDISGSFTETSASFSTTIASINSEIHDIEHEIDSIQLITSQSLLSSSAQIADDISGSLGPNASTIRNLTSTVISGAFTESSASFSTRVTANELITAKSLISSSDQIAVEISGAFKAPSASFSTRITANETIVAKTLISSSAQIATEITGAFTVASSSFSTRITNNETDLANFKSDTLISSSDQIAVEISGAFKAPSASFSTRVTANELIVNKTLISSSAQIANDITGSFTSTSSSFSTRVTNNEVNFTNLSNKSLISGSAQISGDISGSFVAPSASFSTRVTTLEAGTLFTAAGISGAFAEPSASFSTRVSSLEGGSGLKSGILSSSAQIAGDISGSFDAASSSFSTRVTSLEAGGGSDFTPAGISGSWQSQGFISASQVESNLPTGTLSSSAQIANDISGSFNAPSSSFSTRVTANETNITSITSSLDADRVVFTTANGQLATDAGMVYDSSVDRLTVTSLNVVHLTSSFITASSIQTSGSNIFGDDTTDTQTLIGTTKITGSAQITGSLKVTSGNISGSFIGNGSGLTNLPQNFTSAGISGSWQSQGFISASQVEPNLPTGTLSSSAQIADDISGSFVAASSSFSTRVTLNEATVAKTLISSSAQIADDISGSFNAASCSFSTRITTNETNIADLTAETGSYVQFPFNGDAIITGSLDVSGSSNSRLIVKYDTNYDTFINGRLYLGGSDVTPRINFGSTNAATTLARGAGTSVTAFQWTFDNSLTGVNHPGSFLRIYGSGSSFERGLNITQSNATRGLGVSGSVEIVGPITASGNISASGALFFSSSLSDDTNLKTLMYNTTTGKIFHTGSYGGGGGGGGFTPSLSTDLLAQNITASANISASGDISALDLNLFGGGLSIKNQGAQSYARFYCESSNAHYTELKAQPHALYSGNPVTLLPAYDFDFAKPNFTPPITASIISASGHISASSFHGAELISSNDLTLDADGADIILKDGGTAFGRFKRDSSDFIIKSEANNEDIIFRGQDGGATIDALLLDMSDAGSATFNNHITASGNISASGNVISNNITSSTAQIGNLKIQSGFSGGDTMFSTTTGVGFTFNHDLISQPTGKNLGNSTRKWNNLFQGTNSSDYLLDIANGISFTFVPSVVSYYLWDGSPTRDDSTSENAPPIYSINPGQEEPTSFRGYFGIIQPSGSNDNLSTDTANKFGLFVVGQGGRTILGRKDYNRTNDSVPVDKMFTIYDGQTSTRELFSIETGSGTTRISGSTIIESSGSTLFEVIGSEGTIFTLEDSLSGSLFSVGDISGLPQFEVFSDGKIVGDEGVATLRTQRPIVTHTTDFNITSSLDFAGKYHIVGGNLTCSIDTGSLIPVGSEFEFFQTSSADNFLFETASHVDLIVKNDNLNLSGRGSGATLKYIAGSTFHLVGDLT